MRRNATTLKENFVQGWMELKVKVEFNQKSKTEPFREIKTLSYEQVKNAGFPVSEAIETCANISNDKEKKAYWDLLIKDYNENGHDGTHAKELQTLTTTVKKLERNREQKIAERLKLEEKQKEKPKQEETPWKFEPPTSTNQKPPLPESNSKKLIRPETLTRQFVPYEEETKKTPRYFEAPSIGAAQQKLSAHYQAALVVAVGLGIAALVVGVFYPTIALALIKTASLRLYQVLLGSAAVAAAFGAVGLYRHRKKIGVAETKSQVAQKSNPSTWWW